MYAFITFVKLVLFPCAKLFNRFVSISLVCKDLSIQSKQAANTLNTLSFFSFPFLNPFLFLLRKQVEAAITIRYIRACLSGTDIPHQPSKWRDTRNKKGGGRGNKKKREEITK